MRYVGKSEGYRKLLAAIERSKRIDAVRKRIPVTRKVAVNANT